MSQLAPGEIEDLSLDLKLVMALLVQLRKSGVLNEGMVSRVRNEFLSEVAFYEGNSTQMDYIELLGMLDAFEDTAAGEGVAEFRAAQRRKALRERNTRVVQIDGGNSD